MESDDPSLEFSEPPGGSTSYDRISRFYDNLSAPGEKRFTQRGLELLAPARGESVLEIGFGTGRALVALARAVGDNGQVYGIDISKGMMKVTQNRLDKAGLIGQVVLEQGHATQLPFEPSFFDAIFMSFTLELFSEMAIPRVLGECKRVLKTDGRLGIVSMSEFNPPTLSQRIYLWGHKSMPRVFDCRPIPLIRLLKK
ncbi:MAG: methyltransferase domain-containing protein, partial [Anaerolineaceae bacterium]